MKSILVIVSLLGAATAHAEDVGVVVTGEATLQPALAAQLEVWLRDHGRQVTPGPLNPQAINTLIDCFVLEDLGCARGVVEARSKSKSLVFARIEQKQDTADGSREISITAYWFKKGHDAAAERRVCTNCNEDKLDASIDELMLALAHDPPPPLPKDGAGTPAPAEETDVTVESPSRVVPSALLGVGALAIISGAIMIGIDEDPVPTGQQKAEYTDTATGGVLLTAVGAVAVGAGVFLWLTAKPSSHPVAAVSRDGGFVGWAGRF